MVALCKLTDYSQVYVALAVPLRQPCAALRDITAAASHHVTRGSTKPGLAGAKTQIIQAQHQVVPGGNRGSADEMTGAGTGSLEAERCRMVSHVQPVIVSGPSRSCSATALLVAILGFDALHAGRGFVRR